MNLVLNVDGECLKIQYAATKPVGIETQGTRSSAIRFVVEGGLFNFPEDILRKFCDAKSPKLRVQGKFKYEDPNEMWCIAFQKYCRQFYNNGIDESLYLDEIAEETPANTPEEHHVTNAKDVLEAPAETVARKDGPRVFVSAPVSFWERVRENLSGRGQKNAGESQNERLFRKSEEVSPIHNFGAALKLIFITGLMTYCLPVYALYCIVERNGVRRISWQSFSTQWGVKYIIATIFWMSSAFIVMMIMGANGYRFE